MKSPKLLALENTLDILGQQREHAIFVLESRIEENDAPASLFAAHRNLLRDQEDFLRAQIKALKENENHEDALPQSPATEPTKLPEYPGNPFPPQHSPAPDSPSRLANALAILLLFLLPAFAHARSSIRDNAIAVASSTSSPISHRQDSTTPQIFQYPNHPTTPTDSISPPKPFFSAHLGLISRIHQNHHPHTG